MQFVSYEFEYFYQCIMTFWGLSDSKRPILMQHQAHLDQNFNDIDPERRFVKLFGEFSPLTTAFDLAGAVLKYNCSVHCMRCNF